MRLIIEFSIEWQANGLEQQSSVLVVGGIGVNGDVHTRDHLRRISSQVSLVIEKRSIADLRVIVDFNLGEQGNLSRGETKCHVSGAVTRRARYALPFLDTGKDNVDQLGEEVMGILALHLRSHRHVLAGSQSPANHVVPGLVCSCADITDRLRDHAGNV